MANLGSRTFQTTPGLTVEARRKLDDLQEQVDRIAPQPEVKKGRAPRGPQRIGPHPAAVAGGLRKG